MDLQEFTEITLAVAEEHGIGLYAPTLIVQGQVQVIQGIPPEVDHREALQQVVRRQGLEDREFFFGVRSGPQEITTGHHTLEGMAFMRISGLHQGFMVSKLEICPWWGGDPDVSH